MSDFANTRSVVVGHFSMYTFNLNVLCRGCGLDCRFCICLGSGFMVAVLKEWSV